MTDGKGEFDWAQVIRAQEHQVSVYTVGLGANAAAGLLREIVDATGGKYFAVADADGLVQAFRQISVDLTEPDSDSDGILNVLETGGLVAGSSRVYYTDPRNSDTDGDGLSDGAEMTPRS